MHVAEFAVRRWQFTLVVFLGIALLGVSSLLSIPKQEDPSFDYPNFAVVAVMPGAAPADVERLVVQPVETRLASLQDVKSMKTTASDGLAVTQLEFTAGTDPARKRDDVLRELSALRPTLPSQLVRLDVNEFNASEVNIIQVALSSPTAPYGELDRLSRALKRRLEGVPGVAKVVVDGLPPREVQVAVDPERLAAMAVSPLEVIGAIGAEAQSIPAGSLDAGARQLSVKTSGDFRSVEEIAETVVRNAGGRTIRVRDVGTVTLRDAEPVHLVRVDGVRAVSIAANQKQGQNIFDVRAGIEKELRGFEKELPAGVTLVGAFDQAENVKHRLGGFTRDFAIAIFLVLLTLLPLGGRAAIVVMVSIPLSLALGVVLLELTGYTINQLSIVGFVIALGLLVDDSIVVVENVTRWIRQGHAPREAAVRATRQITLSVLGCTATLVFAFLPLLALPGAPGLFIRSMPIAVVFTILASLVVSLTVVPFLSSLLLRPEAEHGNVFLRGLTWAIDQSYGKILSFAMARPALTVGLSALLLAGALSLVPSIGFSLFPKSGLPQFRVTIEAPEGASLAATDAATRFAEAALRRHPEVVRTVANVGKGNPRVYYNVPQRNEVSSAGEILGVLDTREEAQIERVLGAIRAEVSGYPGAVIEVKEFEQGPPVDAPIAVRVLSEDPVKLEAAAREVEAVMLATEGTRYVKNPSRDRKSDLRVRIDRDRAALAGVAVPDVDRAVRLAVGGITAATYRDEGSDVAWDVRVTAPRLEAPSPLPGGARPGLDVLERLYLPAARGAVPLAQVADLVLEPSPARIDHFDRVRSTTVTAWTREGFNTDRLTKQILTAIEGKRFPDGVTIQAAGELESRQQSFGGLGSAIIVAIAGVLAVLVLEFRTFRSTLIVASVIPLGVIGGLVALWLTGYTLSFTAVVGFVALMGIEVKNSILLVDFTNQLRREGLGLDAAIHKAGEARFVPILLTTLTALGGLVPLALERSALFSPLAVVIIGGLVSSTILARVVTPVLYRLLPPEIEDGPEPDAAAVPGALPALP
ncbi:MAG: efflux RND transporter permease subunit [Anaeromyxobacter sp.]